MGEGSGAACARSGLGLVPSRDGPQPFSPRSLRFVLVLGPVPALCSSGWGPVRALPLLPTPPHGLRPAPVALAEAAASRPIAKAGTAGNGEWSLSLAEEDFKG